MTRNRKQHVQAAPGQGAASAVQRAVSGMELAPDVAPGGDVRNTSLKHPVFIRAVAFVTLYGATSLVRWIVFVLGYSDFVLMNVQAVILYLCFFSGGLAIIGKLTPKRFVLVMINAAVCVTWEVLFKGNQPMRMLTIFPSLWLPFLWVWTEPDIMRSFGLRKETLFRDMGISIAISAAIFAYTTTLFISFGYNFEQDIWKNLSLISAALVNNFFWMIFVYLVWNRLDQAGLSRMSSLVVLFILINLYIFPTVIAFTVAGRVSVIMSVAGLLSNTIIAIFVTFTTFRYMKNVLPAIFMQTAVQGIVLMMGFV